MNVGIFERVTDIFAAGFFYFIYDYIYHHYAIWHVDPTWYNFVILLLATDFLFYWYHRCGHEINLFWALHIVHHQSPEFNYTTSLRVTTMQAFARTAFWSILPLIGFPAEMILGILIIHGVYPFFTHTQTIGKLGFLEYFLVTPSHHRVHHASNEEYLDKNYGDVFIIWDKMFGTFKEEKQTPVYGLTKPLNSYSFLWQHFHYFLELGVAVSRTKGFKAKLKVIFGSPEKVDADIRPILERRFRINSAQKVPLQNTFNRYVLLQTIMTLFLLFFLLLFEHQLGFWQKFAIAVFVLLTLINCGAILEHRKWVFYLEFIRAAVFGIIVFLFYPAPMFGLLIAGLLALALFNHKPVQRYYLDLVYRKH
ncbi:MAG: sterol desaturase family protein [Saprospiraceae bacterium]|nr:sterol desaturase family protein [Saprospiraceae bacterium]